MLSDAEWELADELDLPTFTIIEGDEYLKRLTLIVSKDVSNMSSTQSSHRTNTQRKS